MAADMATRLQSGKYQCDRDGANASSCPGLYSHWRQVWLLLYPNPGDDFCAHPVFAVPSKCSASCCFALSGIAYRIYSLEPAFCTIQRMLHSLSELGFWISWWRSLWIVKSLVQFSSATLGAYGA